MKGLYLSGKQIRVFVSGVVYDKLKKEAKNLGLTLAQYSGLVLNGYKITKEE